MAKTEKRQIKNQIEKIVDEQDGPFYDVIVVLGGNDTDAEKAVTAALDAEKYRSNIANPKDILPPKRARWRRELKKKAGPENDLTDEFVEKYKNSLFANVAKSKLSSISNDKLKSIINDEITKTLNTDNLQQAIAETRTEFKDRHLEQEPRVLWSAESVRLTVSKKHLNKIANTTDNMRGIFPNRKITPPRYAISQFPSSERHGKFHTISWGLNRIDAPAAWGAFDAKGKNTTVAVLDTGVDASHPDLVGKVKHWAQFDTSGNQISGSTPFDSDQHGTHVCGTIAGGRKSSQWIGVAPEAKLAVGMVLDGQKGGTDAQVLAGMDWAIGLGVDVINMSLGGLNVEPFVNPAYQRSLVNALRAGIPVVAAIGNDGSQTTNAPGNDIFSLAIGAVDSDDRVAGFSGGRTQYLAESPYVPDDYLPLIYSKPDISAPGVHIYSAIPGGKWEFFNGTSMATPHVSGAIAAFISALPNIRKLKPHEKSTLIKDIFMGAVADLGESGQDHRFGFGRMNLFRAIDVAKELGY